MYDLVLTGGTIIDPAQGLNGRFDVAVADGKIAQIAGSIDTTQAEQSSFP